MLVDILVRTFSTNRLIALVCVLWVMSLVNAAADEMNAEHLAYIASPSDGATVTSPVHIIFGLKSSYGVAPAGVAMDNTGHHHLIIDADLPDLSQPIPKNAQYRHFGGGQTEATIELTPGEHTLQLLLGDFKHVPHQPPVISEQIKITVE